MKYSTIAITRESHQKIKKLSEKYDIPMIDLMTKIIDFFDENKSLVNADFFQKSEENSDEKLNNKLLAGVEKSLKKEVNRLISFIKVQDRFLKIMKKDILYKLSDFETDEYNPLFQEYEYLISILKELLKYKEIENDIQIHSNIELLLGKETLRFYQESEQKVLAKRIYID